MTVHNSYQIVKILNSLRVSTPFLEIELVKTQNRKERNESSLKYLKTNLHYEIVLSKQNSVILYIDFLQSRKETSVNTAP